MDLDTVNERIRKLLIDSRIVFWEDEKVEFQEDVASLSIPAEVIVVDNDEMTIKRHILREHPRVKYLIYRSGGAPDPRRDWLLDVKLASAEFSCSQSALWAEECGIPFDLQDAVARHGAFFGDATRRKALRGSIAGVETASDLEFAMLCVCCKVPAGNSRDRIDGIARKLLVKHVEDSDEILKLIERCNLSRTLWGQFTQAFGYTSAGPSMTDFALELFQSACAPAFGHERTLNGDAEVFLIRLLNDGSMRSAYDSLEAKTRAFVLGENGGKARGLAFDRLLELEYSPVFDEQILDRLLEGFGSGVHPADELTRVIARRRNTHWYSEYEHEYGCILEAARFFGALTEFKNATVDSIDGFLGYYTRDWYVIDRAYRQFFLHRSRIQNVDRFEGTAGAMRSAYSAVFLERLAESWQMHLLDRGAWPPVGIASQAQFFNLTVMPEVRRAGKVAAVISDALRFEAGVEFTERLVAREGKKLSATVEPMFAMLPSYTQLGMAALLPHKTLEILPADQNVLVDGSPAIGSANREKLLRKACSASCVLAASDLLSGSYDADALADSELVYVYHNVIDKTGDDLASEYKVFGAVEEAFDELERLVATLIGKGFKTVFITADHGFIYQVEELDDLSYISADSLKYLKGLESFSSTRRFLVGNELPDNEYLMRFSAQQLGLAGSYEIQIAKGVRRLRVKGSGSRYVHGGATLQETVVPLIKVTKAKPRDVAAPVGFDVLGVGNAIITGALVRITLYQDKPVGQGVLPSTVRIGMYAPDGTLVSEQCVRELASAATSSEERKQPISLRVTSGVDSYPEAVLRVEVKQGDSSKYASGWEHTYTVRRSFGMDF